MEKQRTLRYGLLYKDKTLKSLIEISNINIFMSSSIINV